MTRKDCFDAVFWIQADERQKLDRDVSQIATHLDLADATEAEDHVVSRDIAISWLANPHKSASPASNEAGDTISEASDANWLIIFDNADKPALLWDTWLKHAKGSILITSRDPASKTNLYFGHGVDVESLTPENAATLLRRLTSSVDSQDAINDSLHLSARFGGLPLAINQVAALILRRNMSFREFLRYYEAEVNISEVTKDHPGQQSHYYKHTLFTTWALESLNPDALSLVNILALLDPDRADEFILNVNDSTMNLPIELPCTEASYVAARTNLYTSSLIKRNLNEEYLVIHRLVQDVARARFTPTEYRDVFETACMLLIHALPEREHFSHDSSTWETSDRVTLHSSNLQKLYPKRKDWDLSAAAKFHFGHLIQVCGW